MAFNWEIKSTFASTYLETDQPALTFKLPLFKALHRNARNTPENRDFIPENIIFRLVCSEHEHEEVV